MARWLGGAKKVAPLLALLAATLAAVVMLGVAASAASAETFSNDNDIATNDGGGCTGGAGTPAAQPSTATPYPSEINVSELGTSVTDVNVTISGLSHSWPDDIGLLLVSPTGQSAILMTDSGGSDVTPVSNINLTFDDAATTALPDSGPLTSDTTYKPGQGTIADRGGCLAPVSFPAPAPASPYGTTLSVFNGSDPNGIWKLYVIDDGSQDVGTITGWSLDISTTTVPTTPTTKNDCKKGGWKALGWPDQGTCITAVNQNRP
jgi:subtilisin-like proprotein convertase family protein